MKEKTYTIVANVRYQNGDIDRHHYEGWTKEEFEIWYGNLIGEIVTISMVEEIE